MPPSHRVGYAGVDSAPTRVAIASGLKETQLRAIGHPLVVSPRF